MNINVNMNTDKDSNLKSTKAETPFPSQVGLKSIANV
jgi:hypothetical protein